MPAGIFTALLEDAEVAPLLGDTPVARAMLEGELAPALSEYMARADAQALVEQAVATALASNRDLLEGEDAVPRLWCGSSAMSR